jgi:hypothetical protein
MGSFNSITISRFLGLNSSRDELSLIPGQLEVNNNYLYMATGGLEERGGGAKLSNSPNSGNPVFSLSTYTNENGNEFLITNQGTDAHYYSSGWNALSLTLTADQKTRWAQSGKSTSTALYGVNGSDSVIKISGVTPTGSSVSNSPTTCKYIIFHKDRVFAADDTTLYFTEVLDFDTWNTGSNTIDIAPGKDGNITGLEVWGDALFIFKERGVYILPNASLPVPKLNWAILRTDALTGTLSPDTVRRTKVGIIYLSTDNYFRLLSPTISFSSGEYTLGGSGSPIISEDIQNDLDLLLAKNKKQNASAITHNDLYIISFNSVNNSSDYNDLTYFADTSKFLNQSNIAQPQPYWGMFTGFDYDFFSQVKDSGRIKLYGAKGDTGQVHETLNETINNDDGNAIESKAILGWYPIGDESTYSKINRIYFVGDTENWSIDLVFNGYRYGDLIPSNGVGTQYQSTSVSPSTAVGTAVVGTDIVGDLTVGSTKFRANLRGNKFKAFTRVHKIIFYYRPINSH